MQPQKSNLGWIVLAIIGLLIYRNIDRIGPSLPTPGPLNPPTPEVSTLMQRLNGQISGAHSKQLAAVFSAAALHAKNDGTVHQPPFIVTVADAQSRIENVGDLCCPEFRLGTQYPAATSTLATYLTGKLPVDGDFNRAAFVESLETCGEALARL